jgi:nucleotide-binding universal stress UspA family protein
MGGTDMFEKILVCLDGSKFAEQIIPYAVEEASHFKGKLVLLQVFRTSETAAGEHGTPEQEAGGPVSHVDLPAPAAARIAAEDEAKNYLESVAQPLRKKGLEVECAAVQAGHEKIGETIVRYAHNHDMGLVSIATHGEGGFKRLAFGSVADYVLRNLGQPLLLIRPKEA